MAGLAFSTLQAWPLGSTHLQVVTTARSASWTRQLSALQRSVKSIGLRKYQGTTLKKAKKVEETKREGLAGIK